MTKPVRMEDWYISLLYAVMLVLINDCRRYTLWLECVLRASFLEILREVRTEIHPQSLTYVLPNMPFLYFVRFYKSCCSQYSRRRVNSARRRYHVTNTLYLVPSCASECWAFVTVPRTLHSRRLDVLTAPSVPSSGVRYMSAGQNCGGLSGPKTTRRRISSVNVVPHTFFCASLSASLFEGPMWVEKSKLSSHYAFPVWLTKWLGNEMHSCTCAAWTRKEKRAGTAHDMSYTEL